MKTLALCLCLTGCASTFYHPNGQIKATIRGDYTYQRAKDGSETITLKHSPVIRASGVAVTQAVTAGAAALLIK